MRIELDSIPLIFKNQPENDPDIRTITKILTADKRSMVEHGIPGMEGNPFLNMGRDPVKITIEGSLHGKSAKDNVEKLRSRYRQGLPVTFFSDLTGAADVTKVLIKDLKVKEKQGIPEIYWYIAKIVEYKDPPLAPGIPQTGDAGAKEWMEQTSTDASDSVNSITGRVFTSAGDPAQDMEIRIHGPSSEFSVRTDSQGIYQKDDVPPGKYTITVVNEEYKEISKEIIIGSGGETGEGEDSTSNEIELDPITINPGDDDNSPEGGLSAEKVTPPTEKGPNGDGTNTTELDPVIITPDDDDVGGGGAEGAGGLRGDSVGTGGERGSGENNIRQEGNEDNIENSSGD